MYSLIRPPLIFESLYDALLEVMCMDIVAFFSRVEELRAQRSVISKSGLGRHRCITLGSSPQGAG